MGTRAIVRLIETLEHGTENNIVLYTQYDGNPERYGKTLAEFSAKMTIVNGIGGDTTNIANGAGCFAAQLVSHLKKGAGNIYLYASFDDVSWLDYTYDLIIQEGKPVMIKVYEVEYGENKASESLLFTGTCAEFLDSLKK